MGSLFEGPKIQTRAINKSLKALQTGRAAKDVKPINLNAGGLSGRFSNGTLSVGSNSARRGLVNQFASTSLSQSGLIRGLRDRVAPGVSDLREARLAEVGDARSSAISNLRDNFARRKILGSSFASDAQTRAELDFTRQRDTIQAETFLQEMDMTSNLINQEFDLRRNALESKLGELNLQGDLGFNLASQASESLRAAAELKTRLALGNAQYRSELG